MSEDQVFEVYLRNADGDTYHKPLREGLKEFLDPEKGYRLTINIEGVTITLRNSWDIQKLRFLDRHSFGNQQSVEVCATIGGLNGGS